MKTKRRLGFAFYTAALLVIVAAYTPVLAQVDTALPLDSIRALPNDSTKLRLYCDVGYEIRKRQSPARELAWLLEVEHLGQRAGASPAGLTYLRKLSGGYYRVRDFEKAAQVTREARRLARTTDSKAAIAVAEADLAEAYNRIGAADSATLSALTAYRMYQALGQPVEAARQLHTLSNIRGDLDDHHGALNYSRQANALARGGRPALRYLISKRLGKDLLRVGRVDSAAFIADSVVLFARLEGANYRIASALNFKATVLREQRRYEEAEALYREVRNLSGGRLRITHLEDYAGLLARSGRAGAARDTLMHVLADYEQRAGRQRDRLALYETLSLVDLAGPRYDSARVYFDRYRALQDSLKQSAIQDRVLRLEEEFAASERRAQITLQASELRTQQRTLWLVGALLLLALVGIGIVALLARKLHGKSIENAFLVKEIHHRVKNNLQVLASMLSLHVRHVVRNAGKTDPAAVALRDTQARVEAMGLVHEQLYSRKASLAEVHLPSYLEQLGETLLDAFAGWGFRVKFAYDIDNVHLSGDRAILLGLIVNEWLTNAMKYAFEPGQRGTVTVRLRHDDGDEQFVLTVSDDGRGMPDKAGPEGTGFGGSLVTLLSAKLGGKPRVLAGEGPGYGVELAFGE